MPIMPPNFVFTDPVAAQNLVQFSQLAQADEAARNQALLGTMQSLGQQRIARENAAAERSRLQSQSDLQREQMRQTSQENALNRTARASEVDKTISGNLTMAKIEAEGRASQRNQNHQDANDIEGYNFLLSQVQGDDPPTDAEFKTAAKALTPDRISRLDAVRKQNIAAMNAAADNADAMAAYWNSRLRALGPNNKLGKTPDDIVAEATKSQAGKYIIFDPSNVQFRSAVRRPRADASADYRFSGPGPANYMNYGAPSTQLQGVIPKIEGLMQRIAPPASPAPPVPPALPAQAAPAPLDWRNFTEGAPLPAWAIPGQ